MYNAMIRFSDSVVTQIIIDMETFDIGEVVGKVFVNHEGADYVFDLVVSTPDDGGDD